MGLSNRYDDIFRKYDRYLPVAFLRALAFHESRLDPTIDAGRGKVANAAKGLFQITGIVRQEFNRKTGKLYGVQDMFDPELNTRLAAWVLMRIMLGYARNHPLSLSVNWKDKRWVELLVFGWNAGFSESSGVGRVVGLLESEGKSVTIDSVLARAQTDQVTSKHVKNASKVAWSKKVTADFFAAESKEVA